MVSRSVWGASPSYSPSLFDDGQPIAVGTTFYTYGGVTGWWCTGGRVYVPPAAVASLPATITVRAWDATSNTANNLDSTPLREASAAVPAEGGWAVATWSGFPVTSGTPVMIGYTAGNKYIAAASPGPDAVVASDGFTLAMSAAMEADWRRSYFRYGTGLISGTESVWGIDVIIADSASPPADPSPGGLVPAPAAAASAAMPTPAVHHHTVVVSGAGPMAAAAAAPAPTVTAAAGGGASPQVQVYRYAGGQVLGPLEVHRYLGGQVVPGVSIFRTGT